MYICQSESEIYVILWLYHILRHDLHKYLNGLHDIQKFLDII